MERHHKIKWTLYISFALVFIFIAVSEVGPITALKSIISSHMQDPHKYVIVFDGGSTGTRIHVYIFSNSSSGLALHNEYFEEVKPGLSSFAEKPKKAAHSVSTLLEKAKSYVPSSSWPNTQVELKATAGLRLLPSHMSDSILDEIFQLFKESPFACDERSVSVLDGEDEGLYAWFTLNFLLGRLHEPGRSVASLDLGGGSTQVTFSPVDLNTIVFSPKDYVLQEKVKNETMSIYTHSYLGLGLMSARAAILQLSNHLKPESTERLKTMKIESPCVHPKEEITFKESGIKYQVRGVKDGAFNFDACYETAVNFLGDSIDQPEELKKREIYALSYYFDRAVDLGLMDSNGGILTIGEYFEAGKKACSRRTKDQPFLCLDSCYILALLHHGLGFNMDKELVLVKQIDGIETSWSLGAAFNML